MIDVTRNQDVFLRYHKACIEYLEAQITRLQQENNALRRAA